VKSGGEMAYRKATKLENKYYKVPIKSKDVRRQG
jgi:hypothetical protein